MPSVDLVRRRPPAARPSAELLGQLRARTEDYLTPAEVDALAVRAKTHPTPDTLDALALAVLGMVRRKAFGYAVEFGVDDVELEAEALSRLPLAVRSYTRAKGGFLNYFAFAACRQMKREGARLRRAAEAVPANMAAVRRAVAPDRPEPAACRLVRLALDSIPGKGGTLMKLVHGLHGERLTVRAAGKRLGLGDREARRVYRAAKARLRRLEAALVPPKRSPPGRRSS